MQSPFRCFLLIVFLTSLAFAARAGQIIESVPTDDTSPQAALPTGRLSIFYTLYCGTVDGLNANVVEAFPLPYLAPGQTITSATISYYLNQQFSTPNLTVSSPTIIFRSTR